VVHADQPAPADFAEQAGVDAFGEALAALQAVTANQHRRVGAEDIDLHRVEMKRPARGRRSAVIADVMIERALPAILELAAGDEHHAGILEPRHIAAKVATVPRRLHRRDAVEDRGAVARRAGRGGGGKGDCERQRDARQPADRGGGLIGHPGQTPPRPCGC